MKTLSLDTRPDVEQLHVKLIRKIPISRRIQLVSSLIQTTRKLSWKALCERYPQETEEKRIQHFIALLYGDEILAKRIAELLAKKKT